MANLSVKSKQLLILDDDHQVAKTIALMASSLGFSSEKTDNVDTFIDRVVSWQPTHVVVDLQLIQGDGIDVIHRLARLNCKATVIIASGLGSRILHSSARIAAENGLQVAGILSKPFSKSVLHSLLLSDVPSYSKDIAKINNNKTLSLERIEQALENQDFLTFFQPKVSSASGEIVGFECLARWPQKDGKMIPPDQFISFAEKSLQINRLTRQVYSYALANLPLFNSGKKLKYALNLSPINLDDKDFPNWLLNQCQIAQISPQQIILELTETASLNNPLTLLENLTQFRIRGFHLSIDDFGVGYSSLTQLARLPFSELKIDQMFVKNLTTSEESQKIVSAVVGLGKSLGLNVVAEGVEDPWSASFLKGLGCDEMQGYYFAKPMDRMAADRLPITSGAIF